MRLVNGQPSYLHTDRLGAAVRLGETFSDIAATETTSKRRIQQMIDLAFLAPDIVRDALEGKQPLGFTSDWCLRHEIPSVWCEQRKLIATL